MNPKDERRVAGQSMLLGIELWLTIALAFAVGATAIVLTFWIGALESRVAKLESAVLHADTPQHDVPAGTQTTP